jgi:uncharacterized surface protein with fasciclin (FAS1) repeats
MCRTDAVSRSALRCCARWLAGQMQRPDADAVRAAGPQELRLEGGAVRGPRGERQERQAAEGRQNCATVQGLAYEVRGGKIEKADVECTNGVIHVLDSVMIPDVKCVDLR